MGGVVLKGLDAEGSTSPIDLASRNRPLRRHAGPKVGRSTEGLALEDSGGKGLVVKAEGYCGSVLTRKGH